ncbi:MAG TPA: hypothetical protein VFB03_01820, partial [Candidatus Saccharimonadales bacterium]|nr:hypothetical protein [Candidatus Saccharimonadales bacterium]
MNIAHLLPYTATFPLQKHNGRYEWALRLAMIQAAKGHQVTIYSSPKSSGKNIEWKSIDINLGDKTANNLSLIKLALSNDSHDIYHSHFDYLHYLLADQTSKPLLATQHWFPNKQTAEAAKLNKKQNVYTIAPTTYMAKEDRR